MLSDFFQWIANQSQVTVIWGNQNAPAPKRPYIAISVIGLNAIGHDEQGKIDSEYKQETIGQREANVRLTYYADKTDPRNAITALVDLQCLLRTQSARMQLYDDGISVLRDPSITNVPQLLQSEYQPQAVLDIALAFSTSVKIEVDTIETVQGVAEVATPNETIYSEPFEVEI